MRVVRLCDAESLEEAQDKRQQGAAGTNLISDSRREELLILARHCSHRDHKKEQNVTQAPHPRKTAVQVAPGSVGRDP